MGIKVGYQGIEGSNSEEAAKKLCQIKGFHDFELIPLVTSSGVVEKLATNEIDYGVMAYRNNIGGKVNETIEALSNINYELVGRCELTIHHSLFIYGQNVRLSDITQIVSHEQALIQCRNYIQTRFPQAQIIKSLDTAISAKHLKDGVLSQNTAVICKKSAGIDRALYLVDENIEDEASVTEFRMIKKGGFDINNSTDIAQKNLQKISLLKAVTHPACYIILALLCAVSCVLGGYFHFLFYIIGGVSLLGELLLLSFRRFIIAKIPLSHTLGYWKYYSSAVSGFDPNQMHDYLRLVEISQASDGLHLKVWIGSDFTNPYVISTKILTTPTDCLNGSFIYWYSGTVNIHTNAGITGVAVLEWTLESKNKQINSMAGWYLGSASKEIGSLTYTRISKTEFDCIKNSKVMRI